MTASQKNARQIVSMTSDIHCSPKALVKAIECDPVMSSKILEMVNSTFFSMSGHVVSVQDASVRLGLNTVKNLALSLATVDPLPGQRHAHGVIA